MRLTTKQRMHDLELLKIIFAMGFALCLVASPVLILA